MKELPATASARLFCAWCFWEASHILQTKKRGMLSVSPIVQACVIVSKYSSEQWRRKHRWDGPAHLVLTELCVIHHLSDLSGGKRELLWFRFTVHFSRITDEKHQVFLFEFSHFILPDLCQNSFLSSSNGRLNSERPIHPHQPFIWRDSVCVWEREG